MRGRKHPLEVFRQNGRSFQTLRDESPAEESEPERPRRSLRPRPARPERSERPAPPREPTPERAPAATERRAWDVRPKLQRAGPGLRGARALALPLPRVMVVLAGLVLVV